MEDDTHGSGSGDCLLNIASDVLRQEILPQLSLPQLKQMRLVSSSWNHSPLLRSRAWCSRQYCWLVMARKIPGAPFYKEFVACCIPASRDAGSPPYRTGAHYWISLSHALSPCEPASPSNLEHISLRVANPAPWHWFTFDCSLSSCLITGAQGLLCLVMHPLRGPPPSSSSPPVNCSLDERVLACSIFDLTSCTVLLVNIMTGNAKYLPSPPSYPPAKLGGLPSPHRRQRFFLSLHISEENSYHILLYSQYFSYVEIYSSQMGSWTTLVLSLGATDRIPSFVKFTPNIQLGDVFSQDPRRDHVLGYSWELNEWSRVSAEAPEDTHPFDYHIFKFDGRVFLATSLYFSPEVEPSPFLSVGVWELQRKSAPVSSEYYSHEWVPVTEGPPPECCWTELTYQETTFAEYEVKIFNFESIICFTGAMYKHCSSHEGTYLTPLIYDIANKSWFLLPHDGSKDSVGLFGFQPRWSSIV